MANWGITHEQLIQIIKDGKKKHDEDMKQHHDTVQSEPITNIYGTRQMDHHQQKIKNKKNQPNFIHSKLIQRQLSHANHMKEKDKKTLKWITYVKGSDISCCSKNCHLNASFTEHKIKAIREELHHDLDNEFKRQHYLRSIWKARECWEVDRIPVCYRYASFVYGVSNTSLSRAKKEEASSRLPRFNRDLNPVESEIVRWLDEFGRWHELMPDGHMIQLPYPTKKFVYECFLTDANKQIESAKTKYKKIGKDQPVVSQTSELLN